MGTITPIPQLGKLRLRKTDVITHSLSGPAEMDTDVSNEHPFRTESRVDPGSWGLHIPKDPNTAGELLGLSKSREPSYWGPEMGLQSQHSEHLLIDEAMYLHPLQPGESPNHSLGAGDCKQGGFCSLGQ